MRSSLAFVALLGLAASLSACAYYPEDSYYGQEYPPPAPPPEQYGPPPGAAAEYGPPPSADYYGAPAPARAYYRPIRRHGPRWCANHPRRCAKAHEVYSHPVEEQPPPE